MLTACANQKRYDISNYVARITNTTLATDIDVGHKEGDLVDSATSSVN